MGTGLGGKTAETCRGAPSDVSRVLGSSRPLGVKVPRVGVSGGRGALGSAVPVSPAPWHKPAFQPYSETLRTQKPIP